MKYRMIVSHGNGGYLLALFDRIFGDGKMSFLLKQSFTKRKGLFFTALMAMFLLYGSAARGQTLAQLTTAAISEEGEGGLFVLAGNDAYRTGLATRFELTGTSDIGFQLGVERYHRRNFYGGGADIKLQLFEHTESFPFDLSVLGSGGYLKSDYLSKAVFSVSLIMSTKISSALAIPFEPYISINAYLARYQRKSIIRLAEGELAITESDCFGCPNSTSFKTIENGAALRGGVRFFLSKDLQGFIEGNLDGAALIGGGINLVF